MDSPLGDKSKPGPLWTRILKFPAFPSLRGPGILRSKGLSDRYISSLEVQQPISLKEFLVGVPAKGLHKYALRNTRFVFIPEQGDKKGRTVKGGEKKKNTLCFIIAGLPCGSSGIESEY